MDPCEASLVYRVLGQSKLHKETVLWLLLLLLTSTKCKSKVSSTGLLGLRGGYLVQRELKFLVFDLPEVQKWAVTHSQQLSHGGRAAAFTASPEKAPPAVPERLFWKATWS